MKNRTDHRTDVKFLSSNERDGYQKAVSLENGSTMPKDLRVTAILDRCDGMVDVEYTRRGSYGKHSTLAKRIEANDIRQITLIERDHDKLVRHLESQWRQAFYAVKGRVRDIEDKKAHLTKVKAGELSDILSYSRSLPKDEATLVEVDEPHLAHMDRVVAAFGLNPKAMRKQVAVNEAKHKASVARLNKGGK